MIFKVSPASSYMHTKLYTAKDVKYYTNWVNDETCIYSY
jgi:hypothetical protein